MILGLGLRWFWKGRVLVEVVVGVEELELGWLGWWCLWEFDIERGNEWVKGKECGFEIRVMMDCGVM